MRVSLFYDAVNVALFAPSGGSRRLRRSFVRSLDPQPGARVLELGCGTGQVTAELVRAGTDVVAVDRLPEMLDAARRRAPTATFIEGDVIDAEAGSSFDHVALAFVLHSFDTDGRVRLLRRAANALTLGGTVGVLDWRLPGGARRARAWRWFLRALEPSATVDEVLDGRLQADIRAANLAVVAQRPLAGGRCEFLVLANGNPAAP